MADRDNAYENVFCHPQVVRELLRGFVPEPSQEPTQRSDVWADGRLPAASAIPRSQELTIYGNAVYVCRANLH